MIDEPIDPIEIFWDAVLSRQAERIRAAVAALDPAARAALVAHLTLMVTEEGWHPEQRTSAQVALETINRI
jgi:hypothetical protein